MGGKRRPGKLLRGHRWMKVFKGAEAVPLLTLSLNKMADGVVPMQA